MKNFILRLNEIMTLKNKYKDKIQSIRREVNIK